ncbi:flavodoxin [Neorhizobium galegae]|uniref:flavodoxin domain-containing protein n=1 Tax=Neorhizobium galegae TaxID=399 RepID=UPI001ED6A8EC|nr:flavodoxin [Neorhizobium galegae]MDQ0138167.1 flavodoxin [Neorhizobium galegae]
MHVAPTTGSNPARGPKAQRIIVLAATYGNGAAPASAGGFLDDFERCPVIPGLPLAVVGFGDRSFPAFCGFAAEIAQVAVQRG